MFKKYESSGRLVSFSINFLNSLLICYSYSISVLFFLRSGILQVQLVALSRLHQVALKSLDVRVTATPVEHVFSSGRLFMKPYKA